MKEIEKVSVRAQVETRGSWAASLNCTDGETSPKPNSGTTSHPVKKIKTSLRFGDPLWPSFERNKFIVYYYTPYVHAQCVDACTKKSDNNNTYGS